MERILIIAFGYLRLPEKDLCSNSRIMYTILSALDASVLCAMQLHAFLRISKWLGVTLKANVDLAEKYTLQVA